MKTYDTPAPGEFPPTVIALEVTRLQVNNGRMSRQVVAFNEFLVAVIAL